MAMPEHSPQHKHRHGLRALLRFLLYFLSFFLVCFAFWTSDNFGEPPLDQVLYHLQFGMDLLATAFRFKRRFDGRTGRSRIKK